jgi:hypothetical protein
MLQLPRIPTPIAKLPRDERGYPVPWFVSWENGKPVFPVADGRKWSLAVKNKLCWVCGQKLGPMMAFVIGPMCGVTRTSGEPPCHIDCALFSAKACPFLTKPKMKRMNLDDERYEDLPGMAIKRNPGCCAVWVTRSYETFPASNGGRLIEIGEPTVVHWFAEGRQATRDEILQSIESGLPALREVAEQEGVRSLQALIHRVEVLKKRLPK